MKPMKKLILITILTLIIFGLIGVFGYYKYGLFTPFSSLQAKRDIKNGLIQVMVYGELGLNEKLENSVAEKYGFRFKRATDCNVNQIMINGIESYNRVVKKHLTKTHGENWETKFNEQLDKTLQQDLFKVFLNRENQTQLAIFDTIVPLEYLSEIKYESLTNMQIFEGFDYPKLRIEKENNRTVLSNDSIKITLTTIPFDSVRFKKSYKTDSSLYFKSLYFREFPVEFDYPPFFPNTEISEIKLMIRERTIKVPDNYCKDLYNPALENYKYGDIELFGLNGYIADNGKILMTLFCGEGAGAYKVIFIFDESGKIEKRIEEPVI